MKILYIGDLWVGSTALQRLKALQEIAQCSFLDSTPKIASLIQKFLYKVGVKLKMYWTFNRINTRVIEEARKHTFDLIWIDKGLSVRARTIKKLMALPTKPKLVFYSPDDMSNPANHSVHYLRSIPLFDLHVTTKSYNVAELKSKGARDVYFVGNSFDPSVHKTIELDPTERMKWGADVSFIGSWEQERFDYLFFLAENKITVRVWGEEWRSYEKAHSNVKVVPKSAWDLDYSKVLNASAINLCFLKKGNRDLQTTRSIEIPACGAFMLAERTLEHQQLFKEDEEAVFFSSEKELLEKVNFYLRNDLLRKKIAAAGQRRCIASGYSNKDRLAEVLHYLNLNQHKIETT